jgi:muramoyltetrapeptide carboxypeptidase LdcA involved in peptidoglycan recycling
MEIKITEQKDRLVATLAAILTCCLMLTSCTDDDVVVVNPDQPVVLNCMKPDYLKSGDKVALISPSYYTPMENVEKTADVLRSWGLDPVVGPNVGKVPRYEVPAHKQNITGKASGILVGGNVCTFAPNLGSQADATKGKDIILFV